MMKSQLYAVHIALVIITALIGRPSDAACNEIDEALLGAWESTFTDAVGQRTRRVWEFREDRTYTYHSYDGHSGSYEIKERTVIVKATDQMWSHMASSGLDMTYTFDGEDVLQLPGPSGRVTWTRVTDNMYFMTEKIGAQYVPKHLPVIVARTLFAVAKPWREDAIPVSLMVKSVPYQTFHLRLQFISPTDKAGLGVDVYKFEQKVRKHSHVTWGSHAIPTFFVDLPETIPLAQEQGVAGQLKEAMLKHWERGHQAWTLNVSGKGIALEAMTGKRNIQTS